jgi:hypothetical protein
MDVILIHDGHRWCWKAKKSIPSFELFLTLVATTSDFRLCFNDFVNTQDVLCIIMIIW